MGENEREREGRLKKGSATILKNGLCMSNAPKVLAAKPQALPKNNRTHTCANTYTNTHIYRSTHSHTHYVLNNYNF